MSWIQTLAETYDNCEAVIGIPKNGNILLPHSHLTVQAQIEISIDEDGNFIRAARVDKDDQLTVIPVTEASASRSSDTSPMPLCDKLCYIAGDYDLRCKPQKSMRDHFEAYVSSLERWAGSEYSEPEVTAVLNYIKKEHVIADLIECDAYDKPEDFVRFKLRDPADGNIKGVWDKRELLDSFGKYYLSGLKDVGLCFAGGKTEALTGKLPAKIRHAGDRAKLISSNDTSGYTYRGRFNSADEAAGIAYLSAQKAHNALRWLIAKQGYRNGSEAIVCWGSAKPETIDIFSDTDDLFPADIAEIEDTAENYAQRVNSSIRGYKKDITAADKIMIMAVDTADGAGQGRLAITYYSEMQGSEFYDRITQWYETCQWELNAYDSDTKKYYRLIGTPSPREIALSAYGTDQNGMLKADKEGKVIKKCVDRIIPCIAERKRFPRDIMLAAVRNAGDPQRYSPYNRNRILRNSCALIRKCQIDNGKEVFNMALNEESKDRDYLLGRLLAVAHRIELLHYIKEKDYRDTNAEKYWSAYTRKPARTWEIIYSRLLPYISKLGGGKLYFTELIADILGKLEDINGFDNNALKENYLIGYYSQTAAFMNSKKEEETK